ncbi:MAG TPA: hypothetical protein VHD83_25320 [Puia sp.]|nr:hypothetical protein [Puia sp.]
MAAQVNSRYYSVANFYVYDPGGHVSHDQLGKNALVISRETRPRKGHLSVDKRFFGNSFIYIPYDDLVTPPLCYEEVTYTQDLVSCLPVAYDGRNKFLRGPPSDANSI